MIPVVWCYDSFDGLWEPTWLSYLFPAPDYVHMTLDQFIKSPPPSNRKIILVVNSVFMAGQNLPPWLESNLTSLEANGFDYGFIHLADEWMTQNYNTLFSKFPKCKIIFRQYFNPDLFDNRIITIPLGYKKDLWLNYSGANPGNISCRERAYVWSFAEDPKRGSINDRTPMLESLNALNLPSLCHTTSGWNRPDCLSTAQYRDLLLNTIFVPSPPGNWNIDCFRLYEALECGCIPIAQKSSPDQPFSYYNVLFGDSVPFPCVDNPATDSSTTIKDLLQDLDLLEVMRQRIYKWWLNYKERFRSLVKIKCSPFLENNQNSNNDNHEKK